MTRLAVMFTLALAGAGCSKSTSAPRATCDDAGRQLATTIGEPMMTLTPADERAQVRGTLRGAITAACTAETWPAVTIDCTATARNADDARVCLAALPEHGKPFWARMAALVRGAKTGVAAVAVPSADVTTQTNAAQPATPSVVVPTVAPEVPERTPPGTSVVIDPATLAAKKAAARDGTLERDAEIRNAKNLQMMRAIQSGDPLAAKMKAAQSRALVRTKPQTGVMAPPVKDETGEPVTP